ncbi:hypothetical protein Moror_9534 [Moniliophthora roreri MCA 2997]|uniref:Uncharacterized protein n=2 Tax=Moniliophthora roreri TaxID=221103 RepID=V2WWD9_MONRO|nr:hypothetical protein Moror_9534 [Moniliophthora roreri MCA 2997]
MSGAVTAVEAATVLTESSNCSNTSILSLILAAIAVAGLCKFIRPYVSLSALEKAIVDTRLQMITNEMENGRTSSQDDLRTTLLSLDTVISDLRDKQYSSDDMGWTDYAGFFLWTRWKAPMVLNWKIAKIRRRILRETEQEKRVWSQYKASSRGE